MTGMGSKAPCCRYTLARMPAAATSNASSSRRSGADCCLPDRYHTVWPAAFASGKDPNARSLRSYFLADQTIPWWAIALSIVSAETSTLTIISIPGVAFAGDFGFLQIVIGYMLGRVVVALIFLPKYFQGEMLTAYQLIDQRFGQHASQGDGRTFSADACGGRGSAGVCGEHCGGDRDRDGRCVVDCDYFGADAALYL